MKNEKQQPTYNGQSSTDQYFNRMVVSSIVYNLQVELEVERNVLKEKVQLSDGSNGFIFSRNPFRNEAKMFTYNCHICSVPNLPGERCLYTHISGRRHQTRLTSKPFDASLFRAPLQRIASKSRFSIEPFQLKY